MKLYQSSILIVSLFFASVAQADVIVAEDFLYAQPTKLFGPGGGFSLQDYGGGQNGPAGRWDGRWVSVGDGVISGTDILEEPFELAEPDMFQGMTRNGLSVNWIERDYRLSALDNDQTIFFGITMRSSNEAVLPNAAFFINDAAGEDQIGVGLGTGGFRGLLGIPEEGDDFFGLVEGPGITDGLDPHRLIGKFEINADGNDDRLTVWLDPTGVETAEESISITNDIVTGLSDFNGNLRLDHRASGGLVFWDDLAIGTTWDDVTSVEVPRATLLVDTDSREVRLSNATGGPLDMNFYQIASASESLNALRFLGLEDKEVAGWQENNISNGLITESNLRSSTVLGDGQFISLDRAYRRLNDVVGRVGTTDGLLNLTHVVYGPIVDNLVDADFDNNGQIDVTDADSLCSQVTASTNDLAFDLNGDGAVNIDDVAAFLTAAGSLTGDANLDGTVSFPDFLALSANFGQSGRWSQGDVNCDGTVTFPDFLVLSSNFGRSAGQEASAVPEPRGIVILLFAVLGLQGWRRRRDH